MCAKKKKRDINCTSVNVLSWTPSGPSVDVTEETQSRGGAGGGERVKTTQISKVHEETSCKFTGSALKRG